MAAAVAWLSSRPLLSAGSTSESVVSERDLTSWRRTVDKGNSTDLNLCDDASASRLPPFDVSTLAEATGQIIEWVAGYRERDAAGHSSGCAVSVRSVWGTQTL
jgi:hypothetical protein